MFEKLTGSELIGFLNENSEMDAREQMLQAGYCKVRDGKTSYLKTAFYKAISEAQGVKLAKEPYSPPTRKLNYEVKVTPRGIVPVSQCYTSQIGIEPGDYCKIEIEDDLLILTRVKKEEDELDLASERDRLEPEPACPMPQPEACGI